MRWSVYAAQEEEQLDGWQLCVEGQEESYGTCAGRRDGLVLLAYHYATDQKATMTPLIVSSNNPI
jgi:hypothetical protein